MASITNSMINNLTNANWISSNITGPLSPQLSNTTSINFNGFNYPVTNSQISNNNLFNSLQGSNFIGTQQIDSNNNYIDGNQYVDMTQLNKYEAYQDVTATQPYDCVVQNQQFTFNNQDFVNYPYLPDKHVKIEAIQESDTKCSEFNNS